MTRAQSRHIQYMGGFKYMLEQDAWFYTGIILPEDFVTKRVVHYANGWMRVLEGFCWDGCSGPTWDDKTNMRAGLAHDGFYYLHRHGFPLEYRLQADNLLYTLMIEDGAPKWRASYYRWAVRKFGKGSAEPRNQRQVLIAP